MQPISFGRHRFPPEANGHAVWVDAQFTLIFRGVDNGCVAVGIAATIATNPKAGNMGWSIGSAEWLSDMALKTGHRLGGNAGRGPKPLALSKGLLQLSP
jgi:hypothetical protein